MNKDSLELRLKEIVDAIANTERYIAQATSNLNILIGGKSEVLHWISTFADVAQPAIDEVQKVADEGLTPDAAPKQE